MKFSRLNLKFDDVYGLKYVPPETEFESFIFEFELKNSNSPNFSAKFDMIKFVNRQL